MALYFCIVSLNFDLSSSFLTDVAPDAVFFLDDDFFEEELLSDESDAVRPPFFRCFFAPPLKSSNSEDGCFINDNDGFNALLVPKVLNGTLHCLATQVDSDRANHNEPI